LKSAISITCPQVQARKLALYLYIAAYVFIGFLFGLHSDHQS
jgi:hypothetical protein